MSSGGESDDGAFAENEVRSGFEGDGLTGEEKWIEGALRGNVIASFLDRRACDLSLASRVGENARMEVGCGIPYPSLAPSQCGMSCHNVTTCFKHYNFV